MHDLPYAAGKTEAGHSMQDVKSDPCFRLNRVSKLYPVRPGLDQMIADWKAPKESPSYFSVGSETARVGLWVTILQPGVLSFRSDV